VNITRLVLPGAAVALAATLLVPQPSEGFATLGFKLPQSQRDFRIFNNFSDPGANNNTVIDPDFPGYDGAELAIWKGCVEWASEPHNMNGLGDPTQTVLGSGQANFDPSFQGNANGIGGINDNVHSELTGSSGGVLAFTESPDTSGWRIRYYSVWNWKDGPGSVSSGTDLQGVACHEYGHALGMDHSANTGATMYPSIFGSGTSQRSINADDIAGIQSIYGVIDLTKKPHIETLVGGATIHITGFNFELTDNEVWFTQAGSGGNGDPKKVTGVVSDGTTIDVVAPASAGAGDVLIKKGFVTGQKGISNPFAWDPTTGPSCGVVINYCTPGTSASGCTPSLTTTGEPSATNAQPFVVSSTNMEGSKDGLFFYGTNGQQAVSWGNGSSFQCVIPPVKRGGLLNGTGTPNTCDGLLSQDINARWAAKPAHNPGAGAIMQLQLWYRDPANTSNQTTSLTDAIEFVVCP